jgi:hypothetical protein
MVLTVIFHSKALTNKCRRHEWGAIRYQLKQTLLAPHLTEYSASATCAWTSVIQQATNQIHQSSQGKTKESCSIKAKSLAELAPATKTVACSRKSQGHVRSLTLPSLPSARGRRPATPEGPAAAPGLRPQCARREPSQRSRGRLMLWGPAAVSYCLRPCLCRPVRSTVSYVDHAFPAEPWQSRSLKPPRD